jgi:hypothetical protein
MWRLILIALLFSFQLHAQPDTCRRARQIEFAAMGFQVHHTLQFHAEIGVNFMARKDGWYNNLNFSVHKVDFSKKSNTIRNYYFLTAGKNYQFIRKGFFMSGGLDAGLFYIDRAFNGYNARNYGLGAIARVEIGWNMKKVILGAGYSIFTGFGVYREYHNGEIFYEDNPPTFWDKYRLNGLATPYVRLILK